MFKFLSSDTKESEKLSLELSEYDGKHKPQLERDLEEADKKLLTTKEEFDKAKTLWKPNIRELFTQFELAGIRRLQLSQNFLDGKERIANQLRTITVPAIRSYCEDLLKEYHHVESLKKFKVTTDKENVHSNKAGARIFIADHNYFKCHTAMQEILTGIETLKNSELESLTKIKEKYNGIIEAIPSEFPFETTEGNSRLRDFFFENKVADFSPDSEKIWLWEAKARADIAKQESILSYWAPSRTPNPDREVGKIVNKHILEVGLGTLMDSRK
jgi:hypothetical protein